ncbi:MAG TPA: hypothetical protein VIE89_00360 [Candidatus Binatia bacterium]|jgi:hypothetical protein
MKKSVSALCKLLLSSTLLWAVPAVEAQELPGIPTDMTIYCHPAFPTTREDDFAWQHPVLDPMAATIVDFYSSCDYGASESVVVSFPPPTEDFQESSKKTNTAESFDNTKEAKARGRS